jgi:hypothetical protein
MFGKERGKFTPFASNAAAKPDGRHGASATSGGESRGPLHGKSSPLIDALSQIDMHLFAIAYLD